MISEIEQQPNPRAAAMPAQPAGCELLRPAGLGCSKPAGHQPPCAPVQDTQPPAADPVVEPATAAASASAAPRKYGFKHRPQTDIDLPSGAFVRVRQLTFPQAIQLGILNMKNTFAQELLRDINSEDQERVEAAAAEIEQALLDEDRRENLFGPLNRVAAAALVCPRAVLQGDPANLADDEIHVDEIDFVDKMVIFEAVMPDEMKAAAVEERHDALKSVGTEPSDGV